MPFLIAAVVLVGLLVILDLFLTFGVIRRLREHSELLAQRPSGMPEIIAAEGTTIGSFAATTVEGDVIADDDLSAGTMVAFLTPTCRGCIEQLPAFLDAARAHPGGQRGVLAVVIGSEHESAELVATLTPLARVVTTEHGHEIEKAFQVQGYPGFALMGENRTIKVGGGLRQVAEASVAA